MSCWQSKLPLRSGSAPVRGQRDWKRWWPATTTWNSIERWSASLATLPSEPPSFRASLSSHMHLVPFLSEFIHCSHGWGWAHGRSSPGHCKQPASGPALWWQGFHQPGNGQAGNIPQGLLKTWLLHWCHSASEAGKQLQCLNTRSCSLCMVWTCVWLIMFGSVTSLLAPKGLCKDHRVSYSHNKKGWLQCLRSVLRCLSL